MEEIKTILIEQFSAGRLEREVLQAIQLVFMYASLFAVGNACATIVLARWDNALQKDVLDEVLNKPKSS